MQVLPSAQGSRERLEFNDSDIIRRLNPKPVVACHKQVVDVFIVPKAPWQLSLCAEVIGFVPQETTNLPNLSDALQNLKIPINHLDWP